MYISQNFVLMLSRSKFCCCWHEISVNFIDFFVATFQSVMLHVIYCCCCNCMLQTYCYRYCLNFQSAIHRFFCWYASDTFLTVVVVVHFISLALCAFCCCYVPVDILLFLLFPRLRLIPSPYLLPHVMFQFVICSCRSVPDDRFCPHHHLRKWCVSDSDGHGSVVTTTSATPGLRHQLPSQPTYPFGGLMSLPQTPGDSTGALSQARRSWWRHHVSCLPAQTQPDTALRKPHSGTPDQDDRHDDF